MGSSRSTGSYDKASVRVSSQHDRRGEGGRGGGGGGGGMLGHGPATAQPALSQRLTSVFIAMRFSVQRFRAALFAQEIPVATSKHQAVELRVQLPTL